MKATNTHLPVALLGWLIPLGIRVLQQARKTGERKIPLVDVLSVIYMVRMGMLVLSVLINHALILVIFSRAQRSFMLKGQK